MTSRKTILDSTAALTLALEGTWTLLGDLARRSDAFLSFVTQAFGNAGTDPAAFQAGAQALREAILQGGDLGITFDLRDNADLQGGRAAYAANGPDGRPHVYVNADWLARTDTASAIKVLVEEIGHAFDHRLNDGRDSQGDEGELFAALVTGTDPTDAQRATILAEDDSGTLAIDGQRLGVEFSIDGGAVTGAGDNFLNASELSGGLQITGISKLTGTGTGFLVAIFTSSTATAPTYWERSSAGVLANDATVVSLTITTTRLNGYQGPAFIRIYQGTSSGAAQSGNITGSTVSFPAASAFSVNSSLNGTALTTANAISAAGQRTLGLYTIDTVAPAAVGTPDLATASDTGSSSTDNITKQTTPTITGSGAAAGASVTLYDTNGTTVLGTATADGSGNWSIVSATLASGAHTLTAKQTDTAGNVGSASTGLAVTIDTTVAAPGAPDLTTASDKGASSTDNLTSLATPTFTGTSEIGATVTLYDTDGTTVLGTATADGSGNWSIASATLTDGAHTLTAKQTDRAGNASVASTGLAVTIDTVAPAAVSAPDLATASDTGSSTTDNLIKTTTPTFTGSGAVAGATVTLYDTNGTTVLGSATADGSGSWSIVSAALASGAHTVTAKQSDTAGNASAASAGLVVTIDATAAAPSGPDLIVGSDSGSSSTDNVTKITTPTLTGSAEGGATVTLYDTNGTTVLGSATADGSGNWSITSATLSSGAHTLTAKQTDLAGNASVASTGLAVTIDTTAPAAPSGLDLTTASDKGSSSTDNLTSLATPVFSGTAEIGATVTLYDTNGSTVLGTATADGSGNWSITSATLADGAHTVTAKQTDLAGNVGVASAGLVVTIDTAASAAVGAPDLATASDSGASTSDNVTKITTPTVTGSGAAASAIVTLYDTDGTTVLGTATANGSGVWSIVTTALTQGAHTLTARQADTAGNASAASAALVVTIDTAAAAPGAPDLTTASDKGSSSTDNITSLTTPTFSGAAEAGAAVTLYDTNGTTVLGTATADGSGAWTITSATLASGAHTVTAKQTDLAGNASAASAGLAVTIDTTTPGAPGTPDLTTASDTGTSSTDNLTKLATPVFSGTGEVGATVTLYDTNGTTVLGTAAVDGAGKWSITTATMTDGAHTVTARQADVAGNTGAASAGLTVTIDTVAPTLSAPDLTAASDTGASNTDNLTNDTTPTVTGAGAAAGATVTLYDSDGTTVLGTTTADGSGNWTITSTVLIDGMHTLTAKQADTAGNASAASAPLSVTIDNRGPAPDLAAGSDSGASSTDNLTSDATPTVSGTGATANATMTLYDTDGTSLVGTATADSSGNWSITSSPLADGVHTLSVKQNGAVASVGLTVTIDTLAVPPEEPDLVAASDTGISSIDDITNDSTPTISGFGADAGATVTLYDTDGSTVLGTATVDGAGNWSITSSVLTNGAHTLTAKQTDLAGNVSAASNQPVVVTIDTTAPGAVSAPDLVVASDAGSSSTDNLTNEAMPTVSGGIAVAGGTVTLYDTNGVTVLGSAIADESGNWAIVSSALADGAHTLTAKQTDRAGNTGVASSALTVTIDTAAPTALSGLDLATASDNGVSSTDNVTRDDTPTVTGGGAEIGATVILYDTNGSTELGSATANNAGIWSITSVALAPGVHTLTAKSVDKAGNVSGPSTKLAVSVDTSAAALTAPDLAAPSDSGASSADNVTNDATPTIGGTGAEVGATVVLYDTNGTTSLGSATADGSGNWTITTSTLTDGAHSLTTKQTDQAGNVSAASAALTVTIDTAVSAAVGAPDLVVASDGGASGTDNLTNDTTPTVSGGGAEAGATVVLYGTNGTTVLGSATADGSGNWSITSLAVAAGAHSLTARQTDVAGNVGALSAALVVTIDTATLTPSAPDLVGISDSGVVGTDNRTNDDTPTVSGGSAEVGAKVTLYDTDGLSVLGNATADGAGTWSITSAALGNGAHTLTVKQTDLAGNISAASAGLVVTIDTVTAAAPSAPVLAAASDSGASSSDNVTNDATPTVGGGGVEAAATVTLYDTNGSTLLGATTADGAGNWSITSLSLANGAHTLTAKQTDLAGNVSVASAGLVVTIDTTTSSAPGTPDLATASDSGASNADNLTGNITPTITGSGASVGAKITLYDSNGTTVLGTATASGSGTWSIVTAPLTVGTHSLTAKQTDLAGNSSPVSAALVVRIDTAATAPTGLDLAVASDSGASSVDNITNDATPTVNGIGAEVGATVALYASNGIAMLGSTIADGVGNWSITSVALDPGTHVLTVKQTDRAGNVSPVSSELSVTIDTERGAAPIEMDLIAASDSGLSNSDNLTNDTTPTVTGSGAEAGALVTLYDTNGITVLGSATADVEGTWSITTLAVAAGLHSLTARQTDKAGNVSAASSGLVVAVDNTALPPALLDLVAASDTGVFNTDNLTKDSTPTVTGTAEAGATVTLYDTNGTTVLGSAVADGAGVWSITSATLANGAHTLTARQTDPAGNVSLTSAGLGVVIDTVGAPAPGVLDLVTGSDSGPLNTDNVTNDTTPTVNGGGAEVGATVTLYASDSVTVLGSAVADGAGNWSITSSILGGGAQSLTARQTDRAGNTSAVSPALVVSIDAVIAAPSGPDLIAASDTGASGTDRVTGDTTPTVTGTGAELGATVTLYDTNGTTVLGSAVADNAGNWTITSIVLANGAHTLSVRQTDLAGNISPASDPLVVRIDASAVAPGAPDMVGVSDSGASSTDNATNDATPTVTGGGAEAGATVTLYDSNGITILGSTTADATGLWAITSATLGSGAHTLTAKQTDLAGNVSVASSALVVTIDPVAATASPPDLVAGSDSGASSSDNLTNDSTPTVTGTGAAAGAVVTLYDTNGAAVLGSTAADGAGNWSITSATLSFGLHALAAKQGTTPISAELVVTIDTVTPVPSAPDLVGTSDSGASRTDNLTNDATPTVTGSGAEIGATVTLFDTDGTTVLGTAAADGAGNWSITSPALGEGPHTLTARQTDRAGNVSGASAALVVTIDTVSASGLAAPDLLAASDGGASNTDDVTNDATPTVSGAGAEAGTTMTLLATNGAVVLGSAIVDVAGNWSITSGLLQDGVHALAVRQTDRAGNVGATSAELVVKIDTAAPLPASTPDLIAASDGGASNVDNLTNVATPTVNGSGAEADATITLYDTNGITVLGSAVVDGVGTWSITSSALAGGVHTLTARQTDLAGNTSAASAGLAVTIDLVAAAPSAPDLFAASDSGPANTDNITNDETPTFTGTGAEAGATVTLFDGEHASALGSATADAAGNWLINSVALLDGPHALIVKQTDRAGNTSLTSAGLVVTIDTIAPVAVTGLDMVVTSDSGSSGTDNQTNDATPTISGSGGEAGATVTLYDTNGSTVLGTTTVGTGGTWSITTALLTNGAHTLTARQTDLAGNLSVASAGLAITIDTVAGVVNAPDLLAVSDSGVSRTDNLTNDATPTVRGSGAENGATVTVYDTDGTTVVGSATADAAGVWSVTAATLADGAHTLTAKQMDRAGNASAVSAGLVVTIDTMAPAEPSAPVLASASDSGASHEDDVTNDSTPMVSGGGGEVGTVVILYDTNGSTVLGSVVADSVGNWSITSSQLSDGAHTLTTKQTDRAGNVSAASDALVVTIDTVAPAAVNAPDLLTASDSGASSTDNVTNVATPRISGTGAKSGATVTLYDASIFTSTAVGSATADQSGAWSIATSALSHGTHTLTAKQTDQAGNTSSVSPALVVTIDTAVAAPGAPDLAALSDSGASSTDNVTNDATPTMNGSGAEAGATVILYGTNGSTSLGSATADGAGNWSITSSSLSNGAHTLTAKQTDRAGNVSAASVALTVTIDTVASGAPPVPDLVAASDLGVSNSDNLTHDATPTLSGTGGEVGSTVTLYDTNGTTVLGSGTVDGNGAWSVTSAVLNHGKHILTAKQTDLAGNVSVASTGLAVTIDTVAAPVSGLDLAVGSDSGVSSADNVTVATTPTVGGSGAEIGASVTLYDTDGTTVLGSTTADGAGNWTIVSSALADGVHTLTARQTDQAGNVSVHSGALVVTTDTAAPAALAVPDLDAASDNGSSSTDNITNDTTPTVAGGGAEVGAKITLYDTNGTTVLGTATVDGVGDWAITSLALGDGAHTLTVRQTDRAGNVGAVSTGLAVTIDTVATGALGVPDLLTASDSGAAGSDNNTNDTTPTLTGGGAVAGATVTLYDLTVLTATEVGHATADGSGNWTITSDALADGRHTLAVTQTDLAGNVSAISTALTVITDTVTIAPDILRITMASILGAAEPGLKITLSDSATVIATSVVDTVGNWLVPLALATGFHSLTGTTTDAAGNVSASSAVISTYIGTAGVDTLAGGAGADVIVGGLGNDTYTVNDSGDVVTELLGEGTDTVNASVGYVLPNASEIEFLYSTATGGIGLALTGNDFDSTIVGGTGNDTLAGGGDVDILTGGGGADTFAMLVLSDSMLAASDRITDFSIAQGDLIDLQLLDADTTALADQAFGFIGTAAFSNVAGQLRYQAASGDTQVMGDVDGDAVADFTIVLTGTPTLTASNFIL